MGKYAGHMLCDCFVLFLWGLVACQGTPTPTPTIEPTMTMVAAAATPTLTLTPSPHPTTPTFTPTTAATATPLPTVSPLRKIGELPINGFQFPNLEISPDGTLLAISVGEHENALYIFDMLTQTVKWRIENVTGEMTGYSSVTFSPDVNYLAAWDNGYSMFVWDMKNGEMVYRMRFGRNEEVFAESISFSPDGQLLTLSSLNAPAFIYRMETGELVDTFPSPNIVTYPPTANDDHFLSPGRHFGEIMDVEFVPNHANLLAITVYADPFVEGEGTGGLYFWDMETQTLESSIPGEGGYSMIVSPDGQFLVVRIDDLVVGWDILHKRETFVINNLTGDTYLSAITDAGFFVTLSETSGLMVWNFSGELVATLNSDKRVWDVLFTPDGHLLITYLVENSPIEIWEISG